MDSFRCRLVLGLTDVSLKVNQFSVKASFRLLYSRQEGGKLRSREGRRSNAGGSAAAGYTDDGGSTCAVTIADVFDLDAILNEDEEVDDIAKNSKCSLTFPCTKATRNDPSHCVDAFILLHHVMPRHTISGSIFSV